jgi:hypothetical protein
MARVRQAARTAATSAGTVIALAGGGAAYVRRGRSGGGTGAKERGVSSRMAETVAQLTFSVKWDRLCEIEWMALAFDVPGGV